MRETIAACARKLRKASPAFTWRNLFFEVRRALGDGVVEDEFGASLRELMRSGPLPGLLPSPCEWAPRPLTREWDAYFPKAVLLVDRPALLDLFIGSGAMPGARLAVVCID